MSIVAFLAAALCGWAARGLWIQYRHIRPTIRLADDALAEQNVKNARSHIDRARAMLEVL